MTHPTTGDTRLLLEDLLRGEGWVRVEDLTRRALARDSTVRAVERALDHLLLLRRVERRYRPAEPGAWLRVPEVRLVAT